MKVLTNIIITTTTVITNTDVYQTKKSFHFCFATLLVNQTILTVNIW